jgi:cytochrome c oxidase subunit 2
VARNLQARGDRPVPAESSLGSSSLGSSIQSRVRRPLARFLRVAGLALLGLIALSGCTTDEFLRFGWPAGVSDQAVKMETLWTWSVVAALAVGCFVWGLIFWSIIVYRKKSDELPAQTRFNAPIEVLYTVVPVLIVLVLFYYTAVVQVNVGNQKPDPDVTVSVGAFKWNWQFTYPRETDTRNNPVSVTGTPDRIPILVVPTDQRIRFVETSNDVIHSFWVPNLLFKRDVIPGRINSFEVTIIEEGAYVGRCAELCGTYHAYMNFEMRAVSPDDYEAFIDARKAGRSTAEALEAIGQSPVAETTTPFNTDRTLRRPS